MIWKNRLTPLDVYYLTGLTRMSRTFTTSLIYRQTSMGIDIEYKQPFIPLVDQTRRKPKLIIPLRICFTKSFKVDYRTFWH